MRGKLRDKRTTNKHDVFKHEPLIERRRSNKHTNRIATWLEQIDDEDEDEIYEIEPEETEEVTSTPNKKYESSRIFGKLF